MRKFLSRFWKDLSAASAAEYGLILAIVTGGIAAGVFALEEQIDTAVNRAANCIEAGNVDNPALCDQAAPPPTVP